MLSNCLPASIYTQPQGCLEACDCLALVEIESLALPLIKCLNLFLHLEKIVGIKAIFQVTHTFGCYR